jgi:dihydropteroate synthase
MDIHKPKPIHNWRDFLKEVGTIVLGVSIALAQQGVDILRVHDVAANLDAIAAWKATFPAAIVELQ